MPAIRDEVWSNARSATEGIDLIKSGEKCIRFSGLILGKELDNEEYGDVFSALTDPGSKCKTLLLDWMEVKKDSLRGLPKYFQAQQGANKLECLQMSQLNLNNVVNFRPVYEVLMSDSGLIDLSLAMCYMNDKVAALLAKALKVNKTVVALNISFNFITKEGFLALAKALCSNTTLRYLDAKYNKATTQELNEFVKALDGNKSIEFIDLGQDNFIDISNSTLVNLMNTMPENVFDNATGRGKAENGDEFEFGELDELEPNLSSAIVGGGALTVVTTGGEGSLQVNPTVGGVVEDASDRPLEEAIKAFVERNISSRKEAEKQLKLEQLKDFLDAEFNRTYASLKHCKILTLGDKGVGKTFTVHCLTHRLFKENSDSNLKSVSFARMAELGWTKINSFQHVEVICGKYISNLPINKHNRMLANETIFQFPDAVIINESDVSIKGSILKAENEALLKRIGVDYPQTVDTTVNENVEPREYGTAPSVMSPSEKDKLMDKMNTKIEDTIEKAMRENTYPSFSLWDFESSDCFYNMFKVFLNRHGMVMVFFKLTDLRDNPAAVLQSLKHYLRPLSKSNSESGFAPSVLLIGTFFDELLNNEDSDTGVASKVYSGYPISETADNLMNFIVNSSDSGSQVTTIRKIEQMLYSFNELLEANFSDSIRNLVQNDELGIMFFPLANELPKLCQKMQQEFDDLTGMNRLRKSIKKIVRAQEIPMLQEMVSIKFAKMVDCIMERRNGPDTRSRPFEPAKTYKNEHYMTMTEFKELASTCGITGPAELFELLHYLHETGIVFWLSYTETLRNTIVLNPQYLLAGLAKFFNVVTNLTAETLQTDSALLNEVVEADLKSDIDGLIKQKTATMDLLHQTLINRENFEFFFDILTHTLLLNKVDLVSINKLVNENNLFKVTGEDEAFLIPPLKKLPFVAPLVSTKDVEGKRVSVNYDSIATELLDGAILNAGANNSAQAPNSPIEIPPVPSTSLPQPVNEALAKAEETVSVEEDLETILFAKYRMKYLTLDNVMPIGVFERAFCLIVDALKSSNLIELFNFGESHKSIKMNRHSALFEFGDVLLSITNKVSPDVFSLDLSKPIVPNVQERDCISFEFSDEKTVSLFFQRIIAVMRKVENEVNAFSPGFAFQALVYSEKGEWIDTEEARSIKLEPYFRHVDSVKSMRVSSLISEAEGKMLENFKLL